MEYWHCRKSFVKTKTSYHSTFCVVQQLVSILGSKIHLNRTSQTLNSNNDHENVMRYPWFSRNCHESQYLTGIVQSRFPYLLFRFEICLREFSTTQEESNCNTTYFTFWHFQVASDTLKHFQTLSDTQWCNPHLSIKPIVVGLWECNNSFQCGTTRTEDSRS